MDLGSLLLIGSVFFIAYKGLELLMEAQNSIRPPWAKSGSASRRPARESKGIGARLSFNKTFLQNRKFREYYELLILRSGHVFGWTPEDLLFYKELMLGLALFLLWYENVSNPLFWIGGIPLAFMLPDFYIKGKIMARQANIQRQLPSFVDLLALSMESGLDLLAATDRILEKIKPSPLKEEMNLLIQENRLGTPRKEALQHLAHRVNLTDLNSLTSIIIQSEELGTSLAQVLRNYSEDMRNRRILRAEEVAGKAPTKLLFPMMVFFFPIVFVIILGPLALNFMSSYK